MGNIQTNLSFGRIGLFVQSLSKTILNKILKLDFLIDFCFSKKVAKYIFSL